MPRKREGKGKNKNHIIKTKKCYLTKERLNLFREANEIVTTLLQKHDLVETISQIPNVLILISSDGTKESIVFRLISTQNFITASFSKVPWNIDKIIELEGIESVYYDITNNLLQHKR